MGIAMGIAGQQPFDVEQLGTLSEQELKQMCVNPRIDVGQQMLAAEELTSRVIRTASKPTWLLRAIFWLASASVMLLLLQLWWTSRYVPPPVTDPVTAAAKPVKAADARTAPRKSRHTRRVK